LSWEEQVEGVCVTQPDGIVLNLAGVLHDDEERQAMHEHAETHLAEASWATKVLGVRCVIQIVRGVGGVSRHVDLTSARQFASSQPSPSARDTCLVQYLSELVTGMCQATSGTVYGHQVHAMQRAGLCALGAIVDCFSKATDPDMGSSNQNVMLLQQYEAQLNSTLRPIVSSTSGSSALRSPLLVRDGGALIVQMLVCGITSATSAKRCVNALASPDVLRAGRLLTYASGGNSNDSMYDGDGGESSGFGEGDEDSDDSDDSAHGGGKRALSSRVRAQILLARIRALAHLQITAHRNAILSSTGVNESPGKPLAVAIRSALDSHVALLQRLWMTLLRDYTLLVMAGSGVVSDNDGELVTSRTARGELLTFFVFFAVNNHS
jgi:hypothetical protein